MVVCVFDDVLLAFVFVFVPVLVVLVVLVLLLVLLVFEVLAVFSLFVSFFDSSTVFPIWLLALSVFSWYNLIYLFYTIFI